MNSLLRLLLKTQQQHNPSKTTHASGGFTMVELLVGMIMAFLILTPLFAFVMDILNNDRREQAKATTEQELQGAIDYITQDLQQAVYIYDQVAINTGTLPAPATTTNPIKAQLPPATTATGEGNCTSATNCIPILVFWKREPVEKSVPTKPDSSVSTKPGVTCPDTASPSQCDAGYVYSLVSYYLIKDNNSTWCQPSGGTCPARLARFQIKNGILNPFYDATKAVSTDNPQYVTQQPDQGFQMADLTQVGGFRSWTKKTGENYTQKTQVLVNYLDTSTANVFTPDATYCKNALGVTDAYKTATGLTDDNFKPLTDGTANSFFACVDSNRNVALISMRGSALRRLQNDASYTANSPYFPTVSVQVQGRSDLGQ